MAPVALSSSPPLELESAEVPVLPPEALLPAEPLESIERPPSPPAWLLLLAFGRAFSELAVTSPVPLPLAPDEALPLPP